LLIFRFCTFIVEWRLYLLNILQHNFFFLSGLFQLTLKLFNINKFLFTVSQPSVFVLFHEIFLQIIDLVLPQKLISFRNRYGNFIVTINCNPPLSGNNQKYLLSISLEIVCKHHYRVQKWLLVLLSYQDKLIQTCEHIFVLLEQAF
jgi:hypothetical protein